VRRVRTNTPLQALTTLNDPVFFEAAQALARRIIQEGGPALSDRATLAFRLCTGRKPKPNEVQEILQSYDKNLATLRQHPEVAAKVDGPAANDPDAAAWTMVSNSLLNLDETMTKE